MAAPKTISSENAVVATDLVRDFGELRAVDGLSVTIPRGTCLGLLGPNGAGKTTTVNMLVGLDKPTSGEIRVLDKRWAREGTSIRQAIGVQLQETELTEKLTVFETLKLFRAFYDEGKTPDTVLEIVGLTEKRDARVRTLSGGQKQRLSLGCALINDPQLLFLDEPTTGLDPQARRNVWNIVETFRASGGTILLTTHYMDEAEKLCDDIVIVDHGKSIAEGSPQEIIASLGAGDLVAFTVEGEAGGEFAFREDELLELDGIVRVVRDGDATQLFAESVARTLPALTALVQSRGMRLSDLSTHRPTLEDVFVSLTGRYLRDG